MQILMLAILLATLPALAQKESAVPVPTGTVTGHVIFADTRQPARLVQVSLTRIQPKSVPAPELSYGDQVAGRKPSTYFSASGTTGLDGSFTVSGLPVGEYYALADLDGFISPVLPVSDLSGDADPEAAMRDVPRVLVRPNSSSEVNLALRRGGSMSGRVLFEDGAPILRAYVHAESVDSPAEMFAAGSGSIAQSCASRNDQMVTDSDGRFTLVGLRPGRYIVVTYLLTNGGTRVASNRRPTDYERGAGAHVLIPIVAPAGFHRADARVIELKGSERVADVDIEVRFSALHTVRGSVLSSTERFAPNEGFVLLRDNADEAFRRAAELQDDGSFEILQVPAGSYTITLEGAEQVLSSDAPKGYKPPTVLRQFTNAKASATVLDQDIVLPVLFVDEKKPAHKP